MLNEIEEFKAFVTEKGLKFFTVSAATKHGTADLINEIAAQLDTLPPIKEYEPEPLSEEEIVQKQIKKNSFKIEKIDGEYIITAEYGGCKVANNIKVLPVLTANDLHMNYKDGSVFEATLVDGQGTPSANQKIEFNINGVFYNRVTDNAGQAKLNINLQAGQYIITSSYNGANIANKITNSP